MIPAMCSDTFVRLPTVNFIVTCHVEVVTDITEAMVLDVVSPTVVKENNFMVGCETLERLRPYY